ncbi:hypothetical protein QRX50_20060 [Amycolatopsis carbonis]|uniref:Uncharacterized protein n=1 Tax=Amycolatopsis carbonis TaxID=715471 RepID=A0A9Y2N1B9_9PSEU|nr:hypothetical protein [Amycolatopsis sp. 2-15]WIX82899.1 hypothetical protein QRX50_20060 [Amycolatopsis sp. 2-15]
MRGDEIGTGRVIAHFHRLLLGLVEEHADARLVGIEKRAGAGGRVGEHGHHDRDLGGTRGNGEDRGENLDLHGQAAQELVAGSVGVARNVVVSAHVKPFSLATSQEKRGLSRTVTVAR